MPLTFEVTPYVGYRLGGAFKLIGTDTNADIRDHVSYGLALDLSPDRGASQYELFYSRQSTTVSGLSLAPSDMVIEYFHFGGTLRLSDSQRLQPYAIATLGATRFTPNSPVGHDGTFFSASLGAGLHVPFSRHFSLRLEARGFGTLLNSNTAVFCRSDQSGALCQIRARGSAFYQGDFLAGVTYTF